MEKKWYGAQYKLGVLGGGQLGRMLIQSAMSYDVFIHCMDKDKSAPCGLLASEFVEGDITNYEDVLEFGADKDVLTVEIENVNIEALEVLEERGVQVFPQPGVLKIIKDKGLQKQFYVDHDIPTADFALLKNRADLKSQQDWFPAIQKMRTGGYDGKGVVRIPDVSAIENGFDAPSLLETAIDFDKELSVIVARNIKGEVATFPLVECEFNPDLNLVEFLFAPADVAPAVEKRAEALAKKVIESFDMVGLLAVELFLTKDGELLVNEVAPRPHNSGHHTIECNQTSQFEQHLRSVVGLPLGDTELLRPGVMVNLLGHAKYRGKAKFEGLEEVMAMPGVYVHNYGKAETKPHRKMGHATITADHLEEAKNRARQVQEIIQIVASEN